MLVGPKVGKGEGIGDGGLLGVEVGIVLVGEEVGAGVGAGVGPEVGAGVVTTDAHTSQVSAHAVSCCFGVQYFSFLFVLVASFLLWVSQLHV